MLGVLRCSAQLWAACVSIVADRHCLALAFDGGPIQGPSKAPLTGSKRSFQAMAGRPSNQCLEVPLAHYDQSAAPLREVPAAGDAIFHFRALPAEAVAAGKSNASQASSSSGCLLWQLEGAQPSQMLLQEVGVNEERRETDTTVRLSFAVPLLPAVSCADWQHGTRVAVVTSDGALHTVLHSQQSAEGLARQVAAPGGLVSVPLAAHFQRAGAPSTLLEVGGTVCVGTEEGSVVCLPAGETDPAAAFQLNPTSGLTKMLGGFFGRPGGQAVRQLAELRFMDSRLLCAIHEGGTLRIWDLPTRRMVHTAELLPSDMVGSWAPTLARLTAEPLDAATSILLVFFEPKADGADAAAQQQPGTLITYEIFLEQRGEGAYKVLVEMGPQLRGSIHRLRDLALENLALHTIGAWLLYDDAEGRRQLHCVPLSFKDGLVQAETEVQLLEDQVLDGCQAASLQLEEEVWRAVESRLGSTSGASSAAVPPAALGAAFADAVLAPGRLSRPALHAALVQLGSSTTREEVLHGELSDLKQKLPRWVAAISAAAAGVGTTGSSSATGATLAKWTALLTAYAAAWRQQHQPLALLQLAPQADAHVMLVARRSGMVTALRPAAAPELALHGAVPPEWQQAASSESETVATVLEAALAVFEALGGNQLHRLLWACIQEGMDLEASVLPALVCTLAAGSASPHTSSGSSSARLGFAGAAAAGSGGGAASAHARWRTACRKLPLRLAQLCSGIGGTGTSFASAVESTLKVLGTEYADSSKIRSSLPALVKPIRVASLTTLSQVAWAQLQALLQLALLLKHLLWCPQLAHWSLLPEESQQLQSQLLPRVLELVRAAAVAYWASVTPAELAPADGAASASLDPSQMVVSLRISGDAPPAGGQGAGTAAAAKRARHLPQGQPHDSYVASLLLASFATSRHSHVVRDLADLQRVSLLFAQRLLCLGYSPLHAAAAPRRLQQQAGAEAGSQMLTAADLAVHVSSTLFQARHSAQLAALQRLLPADSHDMRLLFFKACSRARQIGLTASAEQKRQLEEESCSLFFRVAAVFAQADAFPGQAAAVGRCVQQMLSDASQQQAAAPAAGGAQAAELQYYEALMVMYERMGRYGAAARCALAAARQVAAVMPQPEQLAVRSAAQGRLWANVFSCMLESGRYEEAYVALLSIEVAEVQLDCLHRLVAALCTAEGQGGVELLCRLPYAHNMLLMRGGRQAWVPMLEEVVAALQRRAANLDLRAAPQPYKVLADFHITRSNYQAAAGAMLAYARRLVAECPEDSAMLLEAEHALATAVSCLSLVERQAAWVEDPSATSTSGGMADGPETEETPVLTLAALQREYAIVRGHAALAAAMPDGEQLRGGDAEDVFAQLLTLGLHDAAFQLAEAAFVGTQLTRALERVFASLAAACVKAQLACSSNSSGGGPSGAAALGGSGGDDMETDAAGVASGEMDGVVIVTASAAKHGSSSSSSSGAALEWRRLKDWLHRHEDGEHRFRLRLLILASMLRTNPDIMLPPWLMAAFKAGGPAGSNAPDLAGALRVLMRHGRLADAAALAAQHLQHALHSVPSVGMARTSQVYFPQALLDQLLELLGTAGASLAAERRQLADLLQRVRGAAAAQTNVIQQLFAH